MTEPAKRRPRRAATEPEPQDSAPADVESAEAVPAEPVPELAAAKKAPPTVRLVGEWRLVTANNYQVSIGPDALVMLPRHIHPRDIPDFIAALTVAADVANEVYTGNVEGAKDDDRSREQRKAYVTQGGIPEGRVRMKVAQRQSEQATIGRPTRRGRGAKSSVPAKTTAPKIVTRQAARKAAVEAEAADSE